MNEQERQAIMDKLSVKDGPVTSGPRFTTFKTTVGAVSAPKPAEKPKDEDVENGAG